MGLAYDIEIAGLHRSLPLCRVTDELYIGALIIFGDVELTVATANALLARVPEFDVMITAESKGIPLLYEMARQSHAATYLIARKAPKLYMNDIHQVSVKSITTEAVQTLYIDGKDASLMKGRRVLIVDDVISTGESLRAMEQLVAEAGGIVAGRAAILAEGDAKNRPDIVYLQYLPLFNADGTEKEL